MDNKSDQTVNSIDPRITRAKIHTGNTSDMEGLAHFQTYEVFHQNKRGAQHKHVGIVHAPNPDMALLYADDDIFITAPEKLYRNPASYKVMDKINAFKARGGKPTDNV